ncbi:MAG: Asp23/Gls24 family envelope stress response protein, partial [Victivallales bacterium]|nr:Asp23/Gls24 family envelope stress response protein [Victivallales bacterium]
PARKNSREKTDGGADMADSKENEKEVIEVEPVATPANNAPVDINVASDTDRGIVQISNGVISAVVKKYTLEVPGVVRFQQQGMLDGLFDVLSKRPIDRSIELDLQENGAIITLTLILRFGVCIPEVCQNIQETIKEKVETLTGYPVAKVNVNVVDLDDYDEVKEKKAAKVKEQEPPKEEKAPEEPKPEGDDE